ncbi:MAG: hypothetical protein PGN07_04080, partial [Aeromicrobium erythreum]
MTDDAPRRTRVTNPLTTAAPAATTPRSVRQEIDESTGVGEVYVRSLVRAQLRAALAVTLTVTLTLGLLPLLFLWSDEVTDARVVGVPVPWVLLGLVAYVGLAALGWVYVRHAERVEDEFAELVDPGGSGGAGGSG